jgi:hypothetical protein
MYTFKVFITAVVCIKHTVAYRPVVGQAGEKRGNGCCSVTADKHINGIRAIGR